MRNIICKFATHEGHNEKYNIKVVHDSIPPEYDYEHTHKHFWTTLQNQIQAKVTKWRGNVAAFPNLFEMKLHEKHFGVANRRKWSYSTVLILYYIFYIYIYIYNIRTNINHTRKDFLLTGSERLGSLPRYAKLHHLIGSFKLVLRFQMQSIWNVENGMSFSNSICIQKSIDDVCIKAIICLQHCLNCHK